jgi:GDP-L-fucose synthase
MNIFITGASGFLGSALCRHLKAAGHTVVRPGSRECDLTQQGALDKYAATRFDQIFHLAAWTQAGDFCLHHPGEQWIINQQINTHVLQWWQQAQPQARLVSIGTSCSYAPDRALREEDYLEGQPIESLFTYGMTKRMLYVGAMALAKQYGLKYLVLVPSTLYGAGYHTDGRQMHFIFDLIRKIIRGKRFGEPVVLWGNGYQKRELVYVDDFVSVMLQLAHSASNELVNIGAGEEFTIRQFAESICRHVGYDSALIRYDESRYVGAKSKCLDISKMHGLLPGFRPTSLEEGLRRTIDWFEEARAY